MLAPTVIPEGRPRTSLHARSDSEELLLALIGQVSIQLQSILDSRFRPLGVTAQEAALLLRCAGKIEISSGELAAMMFRDKGGITRHLNRLAAKGLINRSPNPRDRRLTMIRATARGRRLAPRCRDIFLKTRAGVLNDLFDVELHQVFATLSRISAKLTDR